jgi:hypothetical protein
MRARLVGASIILVFLALFLPGSAMADDPLTSAHATAMKVLAKEPVNEGAFAACLFRLYAQGLGIKLAQQRCEIELPKLAGPPGTPLPGGQVSASGGIGLRCPGTLAGPAARSEAYGRSYADPRKPGVDFGGYSWGGSGEVKRDGEWFEWKGLSESESLKRKTEAVERFLAADRAVAQAKQEVINAFNEKSAADKSGDPNRIKQADENLKKALDANEEANDDWHDALDKAKADPNKAYPKVSHPDPNADTCGADMLVFLRECDRVDWKSPQCVQLKAQLKNCVDPALIYPDPLDGGVHCGEELATPEEVAAAAEKKCHERVLYGPDVEDPCSIQPRKGRPESREMELKGYVLDSDGKPSLCGSPIAHVTEDSCVVTLSVTTFGHRTIEDVLLWGVDKLGGPIFILPADPRPGGPRPPVDPPKPR